MVARTHVPSGFFALRTPLLPAEALAALGEGLGAVDALGEGGDLGAALASDCARVVARMRTLVEAPEVREALFVASPSLDDAITSWLADPSAPRARGVPDILIRYLARMAARPTPFGLFSGCSVGRVDASTRLRLPPRAEYRRHTRLDAHYLLALAAALGADDSLRGELRFRPSSGLYAAAGRLHYAEAQTDPETRAVSYRMVAVDRTPYIDATLARAAAGATIAELARAVCDDDPEIALGDACGFVSSLVDSQLLVSEIAPTLTGPAPIEGMIAALRGGGARGAAVARALETAAEETRALDERALGQSPARYHAVAERLGELPAVPDIARLFQIDLYKPAEGATLGPTAMGAIEEAIDLVARLAPAETGDALGRFRAAFIERYGEETQGPLAERRMVPLAEVLDEEVGLGFASLFVGQSEPSPLLDGLGLPGEPLLPSFPFGPREQRLLAGMSAAVRAGSQEWALDDADVSALASPEPARLPDAFAFLGALAAPSQEALARGELRLFVDGLSGPSGATVLGRFCHGDPVLRGRVEEHLRAEEALHPDAVFAEVVHLPHGRVCNILARPLLRAYDIAYLGRSGALCDAQLALSDLHVTLDRGEVILFSRRLGRRVIPRLTSAHNFPMSPLSTYRFLCALQGDRRWFGWSWGPLDGAPFLPRVVRGKIVLSLAKWNLGKGELAPIAAGTAVERFRAVQELRGRKGLPRWVGLADGDNVLALDLDNPVCVASFASLVSKRGAASLVEMFPALDDLVVEGPEGRFAHEIVMPFARRADEGTADARTGGGAGGGRASLATAPGTAVTATVSSPLRRSFPPASEWLYVKLYAGPASADALLERVVAPLMEREPPESWFYVRYSDPRWHLRLRLRGAPDRLLARTLPALEELARPFLDDGRIQKIQLDTYEREIERYGGPDGIELAERLFEADSVAALGIVATLDAEDADDTRWRLALRGMHLLLVDLGFDLPARAALLRRERRSYGAQHNVGVAVERRLGLKYRSARPALEALIAAPASDDPRLHAGFRLLGDRSQALAPVARELNRRAAAGRLSASIPDLAGSFLHMHANRVLRCEQRKQELVLYDFLARLYESELARATKGAATRAAS